MHEVGEYLDLIHVCMQKTSVRGESSLYGICLCQHDELTLHWASKGTFDSALWMWDPLGTIWVGRQPIMILSYMFLT